MSDACELRFDVEGQVVVCYQTGGDRLWRCECAEFQRTLASYKEGFCAHVVVAIQRALRDRVIELD
jgi:hypothetical protein